MSFKCAACGQSFSREDSLKRHQASSACVINQALAVARGVPSTTTAVTAPSYHHHSGGGGDSYSGGGRAVAEEVVRYEPGVGDVILQPDGSWATREVAISLAGQRQPGIPRWVWYAGGAVLLVLLVDSLGRGRAVADSASRTPGLGQLGQLLPVGLTGLAGYLVLSKLTRTEISGWLKLVDGLEKAFEKWGKN